MGTLGDTLTRRRRGAGGLLLLALLVVLMAAPLLRHRDATHPLAASQLADFCPFMPSPPADLVGLAMEPTKDPAAATCNIVKPDGNVRLWASLISTRQASLQQPTRTSTLYTRWIAEARASGATEYREMAGAWTQAAAFRQGVVAMAVIEDHGVMLVLMANGLDVDTLAAYAAKVADAARAPAVAPSP